MQTKENFTKNYIHLFNIFIRALGSHTIVHVYNKSKLQNLNKLIKIFNIHFKKRKLCTREDLNCTKKVNYKVAFSIGEISDTPIFFHHNHILDDKRVCDILLFNTINPSVIAMFFHFLF